MNVGLHVGSPDRSDQREACLGAASATATRNAGGHRRGHPSGAMGMLVRQFLVFAAIGGFSTVCHFAVLFALHEWVLVAVVPATSVGAAVGAVVSYVLNRAYTFRGSSPTRGAFARFMLVAVGGLTLNATAMAVLQHLAPGVNYLLLQCFVTGTVLVYSFAMNKCWTFQDSPTCEST